MGKIKMGGSAVMEFEPDYCEFTITVSAKNKNSNDAIEKGQHITEEVLQKLNENLDIKPDMFMLSDESNLVPYKEDYYEYEKEFFIRYQADNHITDAIVNILSSITNVSYKIEFKLSNIAEKNKIVMNTAINDSKNKAKQLAESLGNKITGFEEIRYQYKDDQSEIAQSHKLGIPNDKVFRTGHLSSNMQTAKIEICESVDVIWLTD